MEFMSFSASLIQEVRVCLLPGVSPELFRRCYTTRQHKATLASWEIGQGKTIPSKNQPNLLLSKEFLPLPAGAANHHRAREVATLKSAIWCSSNHLG